MKKIFALGAVAALLSGSVIVGSAEAQDRNTREGAADGTSRKNAAPSQGDKPGTSDSAHEPRETPPSGNSADTTGPGRSGDANGNRGKTAKDPAKDKDQGPRGGGPRDEKMGSGPRDAGKNSGSTGAGPMGKRGASGTGSTSAGNPR